MAYTSICMTHLLLRLLYVTDWQGDTQRDLLADSLLKSPRQLGLDQSKPEGQNSSSVSHLGSCHPTTEPIIWCLPRVWTGSWMGTEERIPKSTSLGMVGVPNSSLIHRSTTPTHTGCFQLLNIFINRPQELFIIRRSPISNSLTIYHILFCLKNIISKIFKSIPCYLYSPTVFDNWL